MDRLGEIWYNTSVVMVRYILVGKVVLPVLIEYISLQFQIFFWGGVLDSLTQTLKTIFHTTVQPTQNGCRFFNLEIVVEKEEKN